MNEPSAWRSRGYLPHWDIGEIPQIVGFRLADSLPATLLDRWRDELGHLGQTEAEAERRQRIETALDTGYGASWLADPRIAGIVETTFLHFDAERYRLHAWVIMPNHVHIVVTPLDTWTLADIAHSWKSFTATKANARLGRTGRFWAREYFDRAIRDDAHHANACVYVETNPVKAGLCARPEDWRYSSAWKNRS